MIFYLDTILHSSKGNNNTDYILTFFPFKDKFTVGAGAGGNEYNSTLCVLCVFIESVVLVLLGVFNDFVHYFLPRLAFYYNYDVR